MAIWETLSHTIGDPLEKSVALVKKRRTRQNPSISNQTHRSKDQHLEEKNQFDQDQFKDPLRELSREAQPPGPFKQALLAAAAGNKQRLVD